MEQDEAILLAGVLAGAVGAVVGFALAKATPAPATTVAAVKPASFLVSPGHRDDRWGRWHDEVRVNADGSGYGLDFFLENTTPVNPNAPTLI